MTKIKEILAIIFKKKEEGDVKMKTRWSWKKILLGTGVVGGVIYGIFTIGKRQGQTCEEENDFEDEDCDYATDATEDLDETNVSINDEVTAQ